MLCAMQHAHVCSMVCTQAGRSRLTSSTALWPLASLRAVSTTVAPPRASLAALSRPSPVLPPVITTVLPFMAPKGTSNCGGPSMAKRFSSARAPSEPPRPSATRRGSSPRARRRTTRAASNARQPLAPRPVRHGAFRGAFTLGPGKEVLNTPLEQPLTASTHPSASCGLRKSPLRVSDCDFEVSNQSCRGRIAHARAAISARTAAESQDVKSNPIPEQFRALPFRGKASHAPGTGSTAAREAPHLVDMACHCSSAQGGLHLRLSRSMPMALFCLKSH